jgi:hypothetical protein
MTDDVRPLGITGRALPGSYSDNAQQPPRFGMYGETYVSLLSSPRHILADEGTYFIAHNATNDAATTIAGHAAPVLADADATMTKPFLHAVNNAAATSRVRAYLDFIEIEVVTAGANGTQACWAIELDTGATRITSAGTALTKVNPNMQSTTTATLAPTAGAIVVGAESANVRYLGHGTHRPSIEIAGDKYLYVFGGNPLHGSVTAAAAVRNHVVNLPPVILGPTDAILLALHGQASQDAAGVYKVRMGWWER